MTSRTGRLVAAALALILAWPQAPAADPPSGAWYRGDLHAHSTWSDGGSSVAEVLDVAELRGLDFFAITDHDSHMGGVPRHWDDPSYGSARMVLLYGIEWTTGSGHANILAARPFPYDRLWLANRALDAEAAVRIAHEHGAIFSINHPRADFCCPWRFDVPEGVDAVEIWNASYRLPNKNHLVLRGFYDRLLLEGRRLAGVGGSDSHRLEGLQARVNQPGSPTTWVFAAERTAPAILDGIRAGRVSVSSSSSGDRLDLTADADGDGHFELMVGDSVPAGRPITLKAEIHGPNRLEEGALGQRACWCLLYRDGKVVRRAPVSRTGDSVSFTDTPRPGSFYRAELRGRPGVGLLLRLIGCRTLALTGAIYAGGG